MSYSLSNKTLYYTGPWLPCMLKPVDNDTGSMSYSLSNKTLYYTGPWLPCMLKYSR